MKQEKFLEETIDKETLALALCKASSFQKKHSLLNHHPLVKTFLKKSPLLNFFLKQLKPQYAFCLKALIALGQGEVVFRLFPKEEEILPLLSHMGKELWKTEKFYASLGGIVGYHLQVEKLLANPTKKEHPPHLRYLTPEPIDLTQNPKEAEKKALLGLSHLFELAFIFPLGGAGERLNLVDEKSKEPLPAAYFSFFGRTLFESLLEDVQALEYLYFKRFQKKLLIPIAIMTSEEKQNHEKILEICKKNLWFGRGKEYFRLFRQISVPVITQEGHWALQAPLKLLLKPGGHGALWKTMEDQKIFSWFFSLGRTKAIVRQINNPLAGKDTTLMALFGCALEGEKTFGFASCPRKTHTAEGVNLLREEKTSQGYVYNFSNIEYTDLHSKNLTSNPDSSTTFPANANLLFVDLKALTRALAKDPLPGRVLNMKTSYMYWDSEGKQKTTSAGRLELLMQNIADSLAEEKKQPLSLKEQSSLKTFIIHNFRHKTLSTIKKIFIPEKPLTETPEGCFYDLLHHFFLFLQNDCKMTLPTFPSEEEFLRKGAPFFCFLHPALGPFYFLMKEKIQGGSLQEHSELRVEIAEAFLEKVEIDGSLLIQPHSMKNTFFFHPCRVILRKVKISNQGLDPKEGLLYWKNICTRRESLQISLEENAEFIAEKVIFQGSHKIKVRKNHRMIAYNQGNKVAYKVEKKEPIIKNS